MPSWTGRAKSGSLAASYLANAYRADAIVILALAVLPTATVSGAPLWLDLSQAANCTEACSVSGRSAVRLNLGSACGLPVAQPTAAAIQPGAQSSSFAVAVVGYAAKPSSRAEDQSYTSTPSGTTSRAEAYGCLCEAADQDQVSQSTAGTEKGCSADCRVGGFEAVSLHNVPVCLNVGSNIPKFLSLAK